MPAPLWNCTIQTLLENLSNFGSLPEKNSACRNDTACYARPSRLNGASSLRCNKETDDARQVLSVDKCMPLTHTEYNHGTWKRRK